MVRASHARETVRGGKVQGLVKTFLSRNLLWTEGERERTWGKGNKAEKGLFFPPASAVENVDEKREGQEKEKYLMEQDGCKEIKGEKLKWREKNRGS